MALQIPQEPSLVLGGALGGFYYSSVLGQGPGHTLDPEGITEENSRELTGLSSHRWIKAGIGGPLKQVICSPGMWSLPNFLPVSLLYGAGERCQKALAAVLGS